MLFYFLCCFVTVISAYPEIDLISEKSILSDGSQARLSGGHVIKKPRKYQVQVLTYPENNNFDYTFCSGVIYNKHHMLTTAACVRGAKPKQIVVALNRTDRVEGDDEVRVYRIIRKKKTKTMVYDLDIAILRTRSNLERFEEVHIAPTGTKLPESVQISGWGQIAMGYAPLSDELRGLDLPLINNKQCQEFYPDRNITEHMICAYNKRNDYGACDGDEGDPAVEKDTNRLIGIVSFHSSCFTRYKPRKPTVMVFVQDKVVLDFIKFNTRVKRKHGFEFDEVLNDETASERPEHEQPEKPLGRPEDGEPAHGEPEHGEPEHGEPAHREPAHGEPEHGEPEHGEPAHREPAHGEPEHGEPEHGEPAHGKPAHEQPENGRPEHEQREHGRPEHEQREHGRPEHERPENARSKHERFEMPSEHEKPEGPSGQLENERLERSSRQLEHMGPERSSEEPEHEGPERSSGQLEHEHPERSSPLTLKKPYRPLQRHRMFERARSSAESLLGEL